MADLVAVALHDIRAEIRRRGPVVNPDLQFAVMPNEFIQGPARIFPCGSQIPIGVQTVNVTTFDHRPDHLPACIIRVPVSELARWHVEVDGVPHLQPDT
jgi:hypothetical protein